MNAFTKIQAIETPTLVSDFVISSYGGGTNSTALLIECVKRGIRIDMILFADTGAEKPHTYEYVDYFSKWLVSKGYPAIKTVRDAKTTLEQDCFDRKALPSVVYGKGNSCSQRFKIQPQDKLVNNSVIVGGRLVKLIGYDADEPHRASRKYEDKFTRIYPLIDWDMGRDECIEAIKEAGLVLPGKSSCYFCPNSRVSEIKWLEKYQPELLAKALKMEEQADLTDIAGLGRNFSWKSIHQQQDAFMDHFVPDMPCDCYDGGAA